MPEQQTDFNTDFLQPFSQDQTFSDPSLGGGTNLSPFAQNAASAPTYGHNLGPVPSTDLVRRSRNQLLVGPQNAVQQEQWNGQGSSSMNGQQQQPAEEDENELDVKIQAAKQDAQGKRKQIPPFVQKLSR